MVSLSSEKLIKILLMIILIAIVVGGLLLLFNSQLVPFLDRISSQIFSGFESFK